MGRKRNRNRGRAQAHDGSIASGRRGNSQGSKRARYPLPELPEEIWHHIHSLVPTRDAARAAFVSHAFQHSWRCRPNLTFTVKTMCSKENLRKWIESSKDKRYRREYNKNVDHILANHTGAGVKKLQLQFHGPCTTKSYNRLNSWLQIAVTPGIKKLDLSLKPDKSKYDFPCSLLSGRSGNTIRYLSLDRCALHPTVNLDLRCLTKLKLYEVHITGDELGFLLSNSFALKKLLLMDCSDIIRLEIPCQLQRLSFLEVYECSRLQLIKIKAPNMHRFEFTGVKRQVSLGESLQVKNLCLTHRCAISYAIDKLVSSVPNLETLTLRSLSEIVNAPNVASKFLHLKVLSIYILNWSWAWEYDCLSLVSFLDASPSLESFVLSVSVYLNYNLFVGDPSTLRQITEHHHDRLKDVKITGFCPQKSLIELTCHILESATSLKCLTLDTIDVNLRRCSDNEPDMKCPSLYKADTKKVHESLMAIKTYIECKVPSTVQLEVLEPCSRCHAL
ncbi:unnamed protein product [Alopecurus aequalis]